MCQLCEKKRSCLDRGAALKVRARMKPCMNLLQQFVYRRKHVRSPILKKKDQENCMQASPFETHIN